MQRRSHWAGIAALAAVTVVVAQTRRRSTADTAVTSSDWIASRYDRLAPVYDLLAAPYQWIGGRRLVPEAVDALQLQPGATAVALGCGTGWSLPPLADRVGPTGTVIGIDLSTKMLQRARSRVDRLGVGDRVHLVEADMRHVELPDTTAGVLAAFSAEMITDHEALVRHLSAQLKPGARIAFCGLRDPNRDLPDWFIRPAIAVNRVFGVRELHRDLTPWTPLLARLENSTYDEGFAGMVYLAVGTVPEHDSHGTTRRPPAHGP